VSKAIQVCEGGRSGAQCGSELDVGVALRAEIRLLKSELENTKLDKMELKIQMREKDVEIVRLRREVYGVEVYDVDEGVTRVGEVGKAGEGGRREGEGEPALKRMRRDQEAGARVAAALQTRLVEVKKEQVEIMIHRP
jgi:hypothetical protein